MALGSNALNCPVRLLISLSSMLSMEGSGGVTGLFVFKSPGEERMLYSGTEGLAW